MLLNSCLGILVFGRRCERRRSQTINGGVSFVREDQSQGYAIVIRDRVGKGQKLCAVFVKSSSDGACYVSMFVAQLCEAPRFEAETLFAFERSMEHETRKFANFLLKFGNAKNHREYVWMVFSLHGN